MTLSVENPIALPARIYYFTVKKTPSQFYFLGAINDTG